MDAGPMMVCIPSQAKVEGHVRYTIQLTRDKTIHGTRHKDINVGGCEKRQSQILVLKEMVVSTLGLREYNSLFGQTPFPGGWESSTAVKLQLWFETLRLQMRRPPRLWLQREHLRFKKPRSRPRPLLRRIVWSLLGPQGNLNTRRQRRWPLGCAQERHLRGCSPPPRQNFRTPNFVSLHSEG